MKAQKEIPISCVRILDLGNFACNKIHGNNFKVQVNIALDEWTDMVADFNVIKEVVNELNHKVLLNKQNQVVKDDVFLLVGDKSVSAFIYKVQGKYYAFPREDIVLLPFEPTYENLIVYLQQKLSEKLSIYRQDINIKICDKEGFYVEN